MTVFFVVALVTGIFFLVVVFDIGSFAEEARARRLEDEILCFSLDLVVSFVDDCFRRFDAL